MTELRDAERANAPIIYGTHERMAEREVEIQGVDVWRGKDEGEGREHHFLSSGSKWCLNVSLSGPSYHFYLEPKGHNDIPLIYRHHVLGDI